MKAILHIGTEKTGTTSIQSFLALNRAVLRKAGFLVPVSLGKTNHRTLAAMVTPDEYDDDFFRRQNLFDPESRRAAKAHWRKSFVQQLDRARPETVLISSEHLHSRLRSDTEVAALRDFLRPLFDQIHILIYLRDPAETAASAHSTAIKNGRAGATIARPGDPYVRLLVDHQATLTRWSACFGEAALTVRLYDPQSFHSGTLLADYIRACDLPDLAYALPQRRNESLSAHGLEVLRRVNDLVPAFLEDGRINPLRKGLVAFFERHFSQGPRLAMSDDLRRAYDQAYGPSNEWVRRQYFADRSRLFDPPPSPTEAPAPIDPDQAAATARAIAELWQDRAGQTRDEADDSEHRV